ncbi:MAG: helix-turn-helix transcriptional regulator [Brevundimonas sp.]|uniref:helix-turn-helix transcriptional regulator n=1 Tax=Brevundimonas sp. TaxID=1871086 RepID=UPI0040332117
MPDPLRKEGIEAAFGLHVVGGIDFQADTPARVSLDLCAIGSVHLANIEASPIRLVTPSADDGLVYLSITAAGGGVVAAGKAEREVHAGDLNVMPRRGRCTTIIARSSRILSIAVPAAQLVPRLAEEDCLIHPRMRSRPAARLLEAYAATLLDEADGLEADEQAMLASHVVDLTVMALGARRDDAVRASRGGVRAARRAAIKADVAANLGALELSLDWIARRHRVSPAYVRALFYDEGTSFTDYVLDARLAHVRTLLGSPYLAHHTIATLALMAGFSDISWFNQAFRRRFGVTPSDMRRQSAWSSAKP